MAAWPVWGRRPYRTYDAIDFVSSYAPYAVLLPRRYDVTGALQYLKLSSYRVALSYREAPSTAADVQQLCTVACEVCRMAGGRRAFLLQGRGGLGRRDR